MKKSWKITLIVILVCIVLFVGIYMFLENKNQQAVSKEPIEMCYQYVNPTDRGFKDVFKLKLKIDGANITGEFDSLQAEKDTKTGDFAGTVGPLDQKFMSRTANVWWNSYAEGMHVTEELRFSFGDGSAAIIGGEMEDRGDGVYVYKKDSKPIYGYPTMSQVDCETLKETEAVEKYIRENISKIATSKPILGGSWYVLSVNVSTTNHTVEMLYEDGHIQSRATAKYIIDPDTNAIQIINLP